MVRIVVIDSWGDLNKQILLETIKFGSSEEAQSVHSKSRRPVVVQSPSSIINRAEGDELSDNSIKPKTSKKKKWWQWRMVLP